MLIIRVLFFSVNGLSSFVFEKNVSVFLVFRARIGETKKRDDGSSGGHGDNCFSASL